MNPREPSTTTETVTDLQIHHFQVYGFVKLPGILIPDEVELYRSLAMAYQERKLAELDEVRGDKEFHQFVNVWRDDEGLKRLTLHSNVAAEATRSI